MHQKSVFVHQKTVFPSLDIFFCGNVFGNVNWGAPGQIFVLPISVTAERMRLQDHTDKNKTSEEPPLRKKKRKKKPPLRQNERLVSVRVGCFENLWRSGARGPEPREARRRFLKRLGGEGNHRGGCDEEEGSQVREEEDGRETGRLEYCLQGVDRRRSRVAFC